MSGIPTSGGGGDALLAGGTTASPQTFTGFNQFDELTKFKTLRPQLINTTTTSNPTALEFITKLDGEELFGSASGSAQLDGGGNTAEDPPQTFTGFNEFDEKVVIKGESLEFTNATRRVIDMTIAPLPSNSNKLIMEAPTTEITMTSGSSKNQFSQVAQNSAINTFLQTGTANTINLISQVGVNSTITTDGKFTTATAPTSGTHLCNKTYVDGILGTKLIAFPSNNIGIGTLNDFGGKLMVYGDGGGTKTGKYRLFRVSGGSGIPAQSGVNQLNIDYGSSTTIGTRVGIYATERVYSDRGFMSQQGVLTASDIRIKENVEDLQECECIEKLKKIRPVKYNYKDRVRRGDNKVYGFIAQEVKEVLPEGVNYSVNYIPDIYKVCDVSNNSIKFDDYDVSDLSLNSNIRLMNEYDNEEIVKITDIDTSNNSIKIDKPLTEEEVFVYGNEVKDFHTIEKDHLWTITTASVIELIKRVETLEAKVNNM